MQSSYYTWEKPFCMLIMVFDSSSQNCQINFLPEYSLSSTFFVSFSKFYCDVRVSRIPVVFCQMILHETRHSLKLETCESFPEQIPLVLLFIASSPAWPETYPLFENVTSFVVYEKKTQNIVQSWKFMVLRVVITFGKFTQEKKPLSLFNFLFNFSFQVIKTLCVISFPQLAIYKDMVILETCRIQHSSHNKLTKN